MTTLTIKLPENNRAVMQVLNGLSRMGAIIIEKSSVDEEFERIPGLPYTKEERIASVRKSMADYRAGGRTYTIEELTERMAKW